MSGAPPVKLQGSLGPTVWTLSVSVSSLSPQTGEQRGDFGAPSHAQVQLLLLMAAMLRQASLLYPQGACRAVLSPQEVAGLSSTGPGPLLGSTGRPRGPGTQGHPCAEERLKTQQCGPSPRSHIPPGVTPVPGALLCSTLSLSLPPLLSDSGKQITICDFFFPPVDEICIISQFGKRTSVRAGPAAFRAWCQETLAI